MLRQGCIFTGSDDMLRERLLLALAIELVADGKLQLKDESLYEGEMRLERPYDLTKGVERALQYREFREAWNGL